jgi:hypothetical protein
MGVEWGVWEMTDIIYRLYVVFMLLFIWLRAESAAQNAMEAHRHTHELACHVGAVELCEYHEGEKK